MIKKYIKKIVAESLSKMLGDIKLDYFAGQALANPNIVSKTTKIGITVKICYDLAEIMLEEREKRL